MDEARPSRRKSITPPGVTESTAQIDMGVLPHLMGYMLRQAQLLVYQDFHHAVAAGSPGIRPPQFSILEVVNRNPGLRPSDVATALGISRANLVPLLTDLATLGWLRRVDDETDGRAQSLHLTPLGATQLEDLRAKILPHEDRLATRLGPVGRDMLLLLLHALTTPDGETPSSGQK
ncbi:MAG: MarR family transcriptional regulator [Acidocella sp.]|nr:MarR family transcriptional regulator [Acidocella sp.]